VPKLDVQVFGTGGSRRAGEQAAAKLALEAVQAALAKSAAAGRKSRPRSSQLKLAGIATIQPADVTTEENPRKTARGSAKVESKPEVGQADIHLRDSNSTDPKPETSVAAEKSADALHPDEQSGSITKPPHPKTA